MSREDIDNYADNVIQAMQIIRNLSPQISNIGQVAQAYQNFPNLENQLLNEIRGMRRDFNLRFNQVDDRFDEIYGYLERFGNIMHDIQDSQIRAEENNGARAMNSSCIRNESNIFWPRVTLFLTLNFFLKSFGVHLMAGQS